MRRHGIAPASVVAVSMPGPGTTERTRSLAGRLASALGVTLREIPIQSAVMQHFADIGHDPASHDVVYENAQARERTQILFDLANALQGLVVGTGDIVRARPRLLHVQRRSVCSWCASTGSSSNAPASSPDRRWAR